MLTNLPKILNRKTGRCSSWDRSGKNWDLWVLQPGETATLAEITGPAQITHIWMTQVSHYRECLLKITYDHNHFPSIYVPLGDFFCLGHAMVNSFQSALFSASTFYNYMFNKPCALNCYAPMPFKEHVKVELVNQSDEPHRQYFYIDYETLESFPPDTGYFHAEFRRTNPFGGWGGHLRVPSDEVNSVPNLEQQAWQNNYIILETSGRGQYIGCNLSVTNYTREWWGEGDDMIWVDGYKWPPDLHGTGSEDYFGQAYGMQPNAFQRNGSSIFEGGTIPMPEIELYRGNSGYQTSYVFHLENPVRFTREIKVTIEVGHANHLTSEVSSVAYWYTEHPTPVVEPPPVAQRLPVERDNLGNWIHNPERECPGKNIPKPGDPLPAQTKA